MAIEDVDVGVAMTHSWVGDVVVTLEHLGTSVTLIDRPGFPTSSFGCSMDNMNIILDDEGAGGAIEGQCATDLASPPSYTPNTLLSTFDGLDSAGDWTITVSDHFPGDPGTLLSWSVHVTGPGTCGVCVPDCVARACGDDGCGGSCGTCAPTETCDEVLGVCDEEAPRS